MSIPCLPAPFAAVCAALTHLHPQKIAAGVSYNPPIDSLGVSKLFPSVGSFLEHPAAKGILRKGKGGCFT